MEKIFSHSTLSTHATRALQLLRLETNCTVLTFRLHQVAMSPKATRSMERQIFCLHAPKRSWGKWYVRRYSHSKVSGTIDSQEFPKMLRACLWHPHLLVIHAAFMKGMLKIKGKMNLAMKLTAVLAATRKKLPSSKLWPYDEGRKTAPVRPCHKKRF